MPTATEFVPRTGLVVTNALLNVRRGAPTTGAPIARRVGVGTALAVQGIVHGEVVRGNAEWYAGDADTFFWSGACGSLETVVSTASSSTSDGTVRRRPNGTIVPMRDSEIREVFGSPQVTEGVGGRVTLDAAWTNASLVSLQIPVLASLGISSVTVHVKAREPFTRVFAAIAANGLNDRIRTCAGTWVPRHKGWDPTRGLSPHTWGIAIDLNAEWNGYGAVPAPMGAVGSVRELVPLFEVEGFAWGGNFETTGQRDGMHFELARTDL